MPTSSAEGKDWLIPRIVAEQPEVILDIGVGEGTYASLLRPQLPDTNFIGVEAYQPYVRRYRLHSLYHMLIVDDVRECDLPSVDVVVLGDVVEHMNLDDALKVWEKARRAALKAVFASIPLGTHPQGAVNDNEFERHRHTWTDETVHRDLDGITASWTGVEIGTYAALPL